MWGLDMGPYGLPFDGIKGIREEVEKLGQEETRLLEEFKDLRRVFVQDFGYGLPIRLAKVSNRAYHPFSWRDMTVGLQSRKVMLDGLAGSLGQSVLSALPVDKQRVLLDIERQRLLLNYAVGTLQYRRVRLTRLENAFNGWRSAMRKLSGH